MKRVLIITYYWYPAGGITVLRCLKIAKYLRMYGWEPIIFTADNAHYPTIDESNLKDISEDTVVLKQRIWEPYHIYKLFTGKDKQENVNNVFYVQDDNAQKWTHRLSVWIRSNFFIPDARCLWISPSVNNLNEWLASNKVDAIFSDGPPHTNTRIATLIKKKWNIPWLADFQDPWSQVDYFQLLKLTKWGRAKHLRMEQDVFKYADAISIASWDWAKQLATLGAKNITTIPYGYDEDDYLHLTDHKRTDKITILHAGIMGYDRNPKTLINCLSTFIKDHPEYCQIIEIVLVGQVDKVVQKEFESHQLGSNLKLLGNIRRDEVLQLMKNSTILLLPLNQQDNNLGRIPGKLFEYLAVRRPILAIGPVDSDVAKILDETQSGKIIDYDDAVGFNTYLSDLAKKFNDQTIFVSCDGNIEQYSNRVLTGKIANILDAIAK
ncbi:MAG: hypothetical protein KBA06_00475 [Saprospiraceae bacterium]|nr:hypothetical protein [Saprospiraceae bacterium]